MTVRNHRNNPSIICPFCGEDGFDHHGLKGHIEGTGGIVSWDPCPGWEAAEEISEHLWLLERKGKL